jgi:hypothetical protein
MKKRNRSPKEKRGEKKIPTNKMEEEFDVNKSIKYFRDTQ